MKRLQTASIHMLIAALLVVAPLLAWTGARDTLAVADQGMASRSDLYQEAQRAMDRKDWSTAEDLFSQVAVGGSRDADAALYWLAYVQVKQGRQSAALKTLVKLQRTYPESSWIDDAKALEMETRPASEGQITAASVDDEEMKLYALNSLMHVQSERAIPVLDQFLESDHSLELKEKALFVLSQSGSPQAREILLAIAKGQRQPELSQAAIEYVGLMGGEETGEFLQQIYDASGDAKVREQVLEAMMLGGHKQRVLVVARQESDPRLRSAAVELLGVMGGTEELRQLYASETSLQVKKGILEGLFIAGDAETLAQLARTEIDAETRSDIIEYLGLEGSDSAMETLHELYRSEADVEVKKQILEAFGLAGDSETLVELARSESDPALRGVAIEGLGIIGPDKASGALAALWESETDPEVKEAILEAFFLQSNAKALAEISQSEQNIELRKAALEYLSMIDSNEAVDFLLQALEE
jgi:hypothetical protein